MQSQLAKFETQGPTWAERAQYGELNAVLNPWGSLHVNRFLHSASTYGAKIALALLRRRQCENAKIVDFGCGTGRFVRFFGSRGHSVVGTDITESMLEEARRFGLPAASELHVTDGVSIAAADESVDMVWVCGVLKYSLFVNPNLQFERQDDPAYPRIAQEMYRVLKPGGFVANYEMFINNVQPEAFTKDFERLGFVTKLVRVLQRYGSLEAFCQSERLPLRFVAPAAQVCTALRFWFDNPSRLDPGLRDYLFVWSKPEF